jgi:hypothetical protein
LNYGTGVANIMTPRPVGGTSFVLVPSKIYIMKRFISICLIAWFSISFQACNNSDKTESEKKDDTISANTVPENVKSAFTVKYPGAADITWEEASENDKPTYKAKFMLNGKKMKAEFDAGGMFIKENEDN